MVADNLLIVEAIIENPEIDGVYDVHLFDKRGRELDKSAGETQGKKLTASFVVAPYDKKYFVVIMRSEELERYKSEIFSTSGGKTIINLGTITLKSL